MLNILLGNYGTEKDSNFRYHNGNDEPQGFGHICITVDDMEKACQRFEEQGVKWKKRMTDGRMKNIAFILDPDNYWIEVSHAAMGSLQPDLPYRRYFRMRSSSQPTIGE